MNNKEDVEMVPTEDDLHKKHRQQRKDLQNHIQSLKKSVPKGDKKKKKEISEQIAKLEQDLEEQIKQDLSLHVEPLESHEMETTSLTNGDCPEEVENDVQPNLRVSRAQRRRSRKAQEEKDREKRISEQAEKNKHSSRSTEMNQIKEKLKTMNLKLYNIDADGNCLYCAIIHQLENNTDEFYEVSELRQITANFIRDHKDDFLPFMYNEMDESDTVSEDHFEKYCNEVATTKLWGGQLELRALSNILKCPIRVIQAAGPATVQGEDFKGPELTITYHRHLYRLGEHYNSTLVDAQAKTLD